MKYNWRIIDSVLRDQLDYAGAVLVQGAKWCGKTTSCEQIAKSVLYMADPERRVDYLQFAETNVSRLLKGDPPRPRRPSRRRMRARFRMSTSPRSEPGFAPTGSVSSDLFVGKLQKFPYLMSEKLQKIGAGCA